MSKGQDSRKTLESIYWSGKEFDVLERVLEWKMTYVSSPFHVQRIIRSLCQPMEGLYLDFESEIFLSWLFMN
jgi:hypothetical protein